MTRITTSPYSRHLVPDAELLEHLADLLAVSPRTMAELEQLTGYTNRGIKPRLMKLIAAGRAHRQRVTVTLSYKYVYKAGPSTGEADVVRAAEAPCQRATRLYPPINRREPLVAAIHGMGPAPSLMFKAEAA